MSAPQVSGVVGLVRSINPLVRVGSAKPTPPLVVGGIRKLLADTASRAQAGQGWDYKMGFGVPNADLAARRMLGVKRSERVRNRAIPLFSLRNATTGDYASVATPQMAMSLNAQGYAGNGADVTSYPAFPNPAKGMPKARAYVLSTKHRTNAEYPLLTPLSLMVKEVSGSARDYVLVSSATLVQQAADLGYHYAGRQGYVYQDCAGVVGCVPPPGTVVLHLKCKASGGCAVFPETDRTAFEGYGYTTLFSGMTSSSLGYAYSRGDSDSDGLPNAAEWVLGTSRTIVDTDGDGLTDAQEYPFADIPVSDPCDGPTESLCSRSTFIFDDGFEE